jgi:hypothetical protein
MRTNVAPRETQCRDLALTRAAFFSAAFSADVAAAQPRQADNAQRDGQHG